MRPMRPQLDFPASGQREFRRLSTVGTGRVVNSSKTPRIGFQSSNFDFHAVAL